MDKFWRIYPQSVRVLPAETIPCSSTGQVTELARRFSAYPQTEGPFICCFILYKGVNEKIDGEQNTLSTTRHAQAADKLWVKRSGQTAHYLSTTDEGADKAVGNSLSSKVMH
nr:hypothetical protein [uncultured Pseudogulbenkiania sp.]